MMVLVTGGSGFLGSYLICDLLLKGKKVRALKRPTTDLGQFNFISALKLGEDSGNLLCNLEWVDGDVMDIFSLEEALKEVDEVYHSAAMVSYRQADRDNMMRVNIEGTANVVNMCLGAGIRKLCHVSSVAATGQAPEGFPVTEETEWVESKDNNNYSISKYFSEMEVWRGAEEGLDCVIVNPGIIIGAGEWEKGSCKLFHSVYNGFRFYSEGVAGFVDVNDVSRAMIQLMESPVKNERFIMVGGNWSFRDLFFEMADEFGKPRPKFKVNKFTSELAWRVFSFMGFISGKEPMVTRESARSSLRKRVYSSQKITDTIGFQFKPVKDSIREICHVYLGK